MSSDSGRTPLLSLMIRLGVILILCVALGTGLGLLIDSAAGTRPIFTLVLSLIGILFGSYFGMRLVTAAIAEVEREAALARARREAEQEQPPKAEE